MESISDSTLLLSLVLLIIISAFFSSSETGMMAINRYKLKHKAKSGDKASKRVSKLLSTPDKLIGLILIGNNFVNILASAIATILAVRHWPDYGIAIATFGLTLVILIFAEVTPKTLAAFFPEKVAYPASVILRPLMSLFYPLVVMVNWIARLLLLPFGIKKDHKTNDDLNSDELRSVVHEAGTLIPASHRRMLLSILDLENMAVEDIMIPKAEIVGINLDDDWEEILNSLKHLQHTRIPVYKGEIDNVIGMLHARDLSNLMRGEDLSVNDLKKVLHEIIYVPEGTPLNTQLLKFKAKKNRIGLVIDEYGDILGLVTLDDILEEIVGEFTTDVSQTTNPDIHQVAPNNYLIDGSVTLRELNKALNLNFDTDGPKTLSGLIVEYLENIPNPGTSVKINNYPMEVIQVKDNRIKTIRLLLR
ncbi:MAG TPA: HlyC/CorC family transporter [Aeromonadales bacterium]|nr:HlyC/CorC family transporter [Aeromonadales bacterium]